MSRSFTIDFSDTLGTTTTGENRCGKNQPNGTCCPYDTSVDSKCYPMKKQASAFTANSTIYIYISFGVILIFMTVALLLNKKRLKLTKKSYAEGNLKQYKMGISW